MCVAFSSDLLLVSCGLSFKNRLTNTEVVIKIRQLCDPPQANLRAISGIKSRPTALRNTLELRTFLLALRYAEYTWAL